MSWRKSCFMRVVAMAGMVALVSCVGPPVQVPVIQVVCLPTTIAPAQLVGDVVASHAIQPGVSSVRLRTAYGEIVTYWHGETLIGIDLEPENKQAPLWMRESGEGCVWRYGRGREV